MVAEANNINKLGIIGNKQPVKKLEPKYSFDFTDEVTISDEAKEDAENIADVSFNPYAGTFSMPEFVIQQLTLLAKCCNDVNAALDQSHDATEEEMVKEEEEKDYQKQLLFKELAKKLDLAKVDVNKIGKQLQDVVALLKSGNISDAAGLIVKLQTAINAALGALDKIISGTENADVSPFKALKTSLEDAQVALKPSKSLSIFI